MSRDELGVGAIVRFACKGAMNGAGAWEYRIEQLVRLEDGAILYKIKCEAEPFDRIVSECDLALGA